MTRCSVLGLAALLVALAGCGSDAKRPDGKGNGDPNTSTADAGGDDPIGPTGPTSPPVGPGTGGTTDAGIDQDAAVVAGPPTKCSGSDCTKDVTGGAKDPFDLKDNPNDGVGLDPDGHIVLKRDPTLGPKYIWIANTNLNTVAKINVDTFVEEGRYRVNTGTGTDGVDPSRSSVNLEGDVFVGSRTGYGLTRISSLGAACPDTNGDGVITTSTGSADVLAYGQDDCVLWFTKLAPNGKVRGVAAQDKLAQTIVMPQPDGPPKVMETEEEHYVWVGSNIDGTPSNLWKLDAKTGAILITLVAPVPVYGLAMSGTGILYMTNGYFGDQIAWIDTAQCRDQATCDALVPSTCALTCTTTSCPATCDGAGIGILNLAGGLADGKAYGITVDCKQRVWLGGFSGSNVRRYDPSQPADMRLSEAAGTTGVNGIGADRKGFVWGATGANVIRIDAEALTSTTIAGASKGIGIDTNGRVWSIPQSATATVIEPGPGLMDATTLTTVGNLGVPYTYSDMTGEQLRAATNAPGYYRATFEGCPDDPDATLYWFDLVFDADVPMDTFVVFRARSASKKSGLSAAKWFHIAALPGTTSPVSIADAAKAAGVKLHEFIEVEVKLFANSLGSAAGNGCGDVPAITPVVKSFGLTSECMPPVEVPMCVDTGDACDKDEDCCDFDKGIRCVAGICQLPVPG